MARASAAHIYYAPVATQLVVKCKNNYTPVIITTYQNALYGSGLWEWNHCNGQDIMLTIITNICQKRRKAGVITIIIL